MIFGDLTGLDPLSLGKDESAAREIGFAPERAAALEQIAHDELGARKGRPGLQTFEVQPRSIPQPPAQAKER